MKVGGNNKDYWHYDFNGGGSVGVSKSAEKGKILLKAWDSVDKCETIIVLLPTHARHLAKALRKTADAVLKGTP